MICLNMIVRNESAIIRGTLENVTSVVPFSYWVIHDTGSTDNTAEIVRDFFEEKKIPGHLGRSEWRNFGENRQLVLEDARGTADYAMFFDADCRIEGVFPSLDLKVDAYQIMSRRGASSYPVKHIVRNDGRYKWRGVVHEGLYFSGKNERVEALNGVSVQNQSAGARSRDPMTYYRDARMLVRAIDNLTPEDQDLLPRYCFYAANSWRDAHCPNEAVVWYRKRIALGGWRDEVFMSYLNLGIELVKAGDVDGAIEAWQAGVEVCPDRAECLYKLAQAERERGRSNLALLYARAAMDIPMPAGGRLFLWENVYRFWSAFEVAWALKQLGRLSEGEDALRKMRDAEAPAHLFQIVAGN